MDLFEKIVCRVAFGFLTVGIFFAVILTQDGARAAGWPAQASSSSSAPRISGTDQQFIQKTAEDQLSEVELGRLATRKAASHQVKEFGQRMVNDHTKTTEDLKKIASSKGISLPQQIGKSSKDIRDRLVKLSASDFDSAYMAEMLKDHKLDLEEFQRESKSASDPELKQFAARNLPTLQSHLKQAESISPDLKAGHSGSKKPSPAILQTHQTSAATRSSARSK